MPDPQAIPGPPDAELVTPIAHAGTAWTWRFRADFAPWLREQRLTHQLTLKVAAGRLNLSFTRLHKLETGGRVRAPSLELLGRIAALYGRALDELLTRAGYKMEVPADLRDAVSCDDAFAAVVLHPALRPACMDERWLEAFSRIQKAQWVEFARRLDAHARNGGATVAEILDEGNGANTNDMPVLARKAG